MQRGKAHGSPPPEKPLWQRLLPTLAVVLVTLAIGILAIFLSEKETRVEPPPSPTAAAVEKVLPKPRRLPAGEMLAATAERPAMVRIPAGTFVMGSPEEEDGRFRDEAQHRVKISRDFYLARTEVTQAQYRTVMGTNPSVDTACGDDCPVENVFWLDAVGYVNQLSQNEGLEACYVIGPEGAVIWPRQLACGGYRLPTEAEWEHAARAGSMDRYSGTGDPAKVCNYGNVADVAARRKNPNKSVFECDDGHTGLAPVAGFRDNRFGLFDMTGNVWEWLWDGYDSYDNELEAVDPVGPGSGRYRVVRGGSFDEDPGLTRVACRGTDEPSWRNPYLGFRVARSLGLP